MSLTVTPPARTSTAGGWSSTSGISPIACTNVALSANEPVRK